MLRSAGLTRNVQPTVQGKHGMTDLLCIFCSAAIGWLLAFLLANDCQCVRCPASTVVMALRDSSAVLGESGL